MLSQHGEGWPNYKQGIKILFGGVFYLFVLSSLGLSLFSWSFLLSRSVNTKCKTVYEATGKPQDKRWLDCFRVW